MPSSRSNNIDFIKFAQSSCTCGQSHYVSMKKIIIGSNNLSEIVDLIHNVMLKAENNEIQNYFTPSPLRIALICDKTTSDIAAHQIEQIIATDPSHLIQLQTLILMARNDNLSNSDHDSPSPILLPDEFALGNLMMQIDPNVDGFISCGSGTITDITRFVLLRWAKCL